MVTMTDYIVGGILVFFFIRGCCKGFLRTIFGPIALVLASIAAFIYFRNYSNLMIALAIGILGPFLINIFFSICLKLWNTTMEYNKPPSIFSRLTGGMFTIMWRGVWLGFTILFLSMIPLQFPLIQKMQQDIHRSFTYQFINKWTAHTIPAASENIQNITRIFKDPTRLKQLQSTKEFQDLMEDPKIIEIFKNEKTVKQIQDKNFPELIANPQMQSIFQDSGLLKKILDMQKGIINQGMNNLDGVNKEENIKPKWVIIDKQ